MTILICTNVGCDGFVKVDKPSDFGTAKCNKCGSAVYDWLKADKPDE